MTARRRPGIGDQIHYVSHGTPVRPDGSQAFHSRCRAAIITELPDLDQYADVELIGLVALNPTGMFFHSITDGGSCYDAGEGKPGEPDCPSRTQHGNPFRYCGCGWTEPSFAGGSWHWPDHAAVPAS